jgi:putative nucleotidyltransferase with HDIG domain
MEQAETVGHWRRVAELSARLPGADATELCAALDDAVEFAACEGKSIAEAIREFLADGWGNARPDLQFVLGLSAKPRALSWEYKLPVMPKAAARLLRTSDEDTSAAELESIAAADQVLAGTLLGAVNSALHGSGYEITRLREAVMRLGIPTARKVLLTAGLGALFASRPLQELWEHSLRAAQAAHEVAALCGVDGETAYTAGLLHDIGRLILAGCPSHLRIAEQAWLAAGFPLTYAETLVHGSDHALIGADLLRRWELPDEIVDAVALHHRPECSDVRLNAVLCLAEDLSAGVPEDLWPGLRRATACERAGIDPAQIEALRGSRALLNRLSA